MTVERLMRRPFLALGVMVLAGLALMGLGGAMQAQAASPWWHLSFEGRPPNVQPGTVQDAVQEVTVSATEGQFVLRSYEVFHEYPPCCVESEQYRTIFQFDPSNQELQEGLENIWGAGTVEVTGGPKGEGEASWTYVIKFVGSRGGQPVEEMEADNRSLGGGSGVTIRQPAEGRSEGEIVANARNLGR